MDFKDYYKTLGVDKGASQDEIQRAYRKLARKYHPDVNKESSAEARFKDIGEAYEVLKDPEKRQRYDQFGSAWKQAQQRGGGAPPGWEHLDFDFGFGGPGGAGGRGRTGGVQFDFGDSGFSSFFDMLFGGQRPGAAAGPGFGGEFRTTRGPQGGADIEAPLTLTLEEAARGGPRELMLTDPATGERKTISVNVPKGLKPGQRIRLAGQGREGRGGGPRGDLYMKVELAPHPRFRLDGLDLHTTLPITPWEAALGGEARVPTLNGGVTIRIPPGTSSGQRIRLRGKGYPGPPKDGGEGDLYAEIEIVVPAKLSQEERRLFEELAKTSRFDPRAKH